MLKDKIIVHIPHASLDIPDFFKKKLLLSLEEFEQENIFCSDMYVDKLIEGLSLNSVVFKYSRLFCDVERFEKDEAEPMSKKGMGFVYTLTSTDKKIIEADYNYKKQILNNYYLPHHLEMETKVENILNNYSDCLIIDLHSFSDSYVQKLFNKKNNPDICLGVDPEFEDSKITEYTKKFFEDLGYSVKINYPYNGSFVPKKYYFAKDKRVKSLMIEVNKRLYMSNEKIDLERFELLKSQFAKYFEELI